MRLKLARLDVRVAMGQHDHSRVGFIIPKHGRAAVRRNRLKRLLRERARLELLPALNASDVTVAIDVVIRARPEAYEASSEEIRTEFAALLARIFRLRANGK